MITRTNSAIVLRKFGGRLEACWSSTRALAGVRTGGAAVPSLVGLLGMLMLMLLPLAAVAAVALVGVKVGAVLAVGSVLAKGISLAVVPVAGTSVKEIRDEIMQAFQEFKASNDERLQEIDAKGAADPLLTSKVDNINDQISTLSKLMNRLSVGGPGAGTDEQAERKAKHRTAFLAYARTGDASGLRELKAALSVGTDASGGYTVPDSFEATLIQGLLDENIMRSLCTVIPSISGTKEIPVVTAHGSAGWMTEAGAFSESDETFGTVTLGSFKVGRLIKVSDELLHDSAFDLESYLAGEFARSIAAAEETGFVAGTGSGQPTGLVAGAQSGKVGTTGQTISVIADDLVDLYHSLKRPYRAQATWLMADSAAKAIRKLKDADGQYLWQPGLVTDCPDTIFGRPVAISDNVPAMAANAKSILFGALKNYWIADRVGFTLQRLNELYAVNGQVGFRGYKRTDGKLTLAESVKYYANSAT